MSLQEPKEYLLEVTAQIIITSPEFPTMEARDKIEKKIQDTVLCNRETMTLIDIFSRLQEGERVEHEED